METWAISFTPHCLVVVPQEDASETEGKGVQNGGQTSPLNGAETWATTKGQEARLQTNEKRMLKCMCGVTRRDKIQNEHFIRGTTRLVQPSRKITEKRLECYGHVMRMKEEHSVRRMLDIYVDTSGNIRRWRRGSLTHLIGKMLVREI